MRTEKGILSSNRKESLTHAAMRVNLEDVILGDRSPLQHTQCVSTEVRCPEQPHSQRQKAEGQWPRAEGWGQGTSVDRDCPEDERALELGGGDGCTTVRMCSINVTELCPCAWFRECVNSCCLAYAISLAQITSSKKCSRWSILCLFYYNSN